MKDTRYDRLLEELRIDARDRRLAGRGRGIRQDALRDRKLRRRRIWAAAVVLGAVVTVFYIVPGASQRRIAISRRAASAESRSDSGPRMAPFATVAGTRLDLLLPTGKKDVMGIGYHQAYNQQAVALESKAGLLREASRQVVLAATVPGRPASFLMASRGRGSAPTSSVDIAVRDATIIKSPVSGRVIAVAPYRLYGSQDDIRIDIAAEGYKDFKVSIAHIREAKVEAGQMVRAGVTAIGSARRLGINSQIDQYLGKITEHVHIQINPRGGSKENLAGGQTVGY